MAWGFDDFPKDNGYIAISSRINSSRVISTNTGNKGFFTAEINATTCTLSNFRNFDTCASSTDSDNMATYINGLQLNTMLIGVTADDAKNSLTYNAINALLVIGVDVSGLQVRGKLGFVARIGQPAVTLYQVAPPGGGNVKITANITGI